MKKVVSILALTTSMLACGDGEPVNPLDWAIVIGTLFQPKPAQEMNASPPPEFSYAGIQEKLTACEDVQITLGKTQFVLRNETCFEGDENFPLLQQYGTTATLVKFADTSLLNSTLEYPVFPVTLNQTQMCISQPVNASTGLPTRVDLPPVWGGLDWNKYGILTPFANAVVEALIWLVTGMDKVPEILNSLYLEDHQLELSNYGMCYDFGTRKIEIDLKASYSTSVQASYRFQENDHVIQWEGGRARINLDTKIKGSLEDETNRLLYDETTGTITSTIDDMRIHEKDFFSGCVKVCGVTISCWKIQFIDNSFWLFPTVSGTATHKDGKLNLDLDWTLFYEAKLSFGRKSLNSGKIQLQMDL